MPIIELTDSIDIHSLLFAKVVNSQTFFNLSQNKYWMIHMIVEKIGHG